MSKRKNVRSNRRNRGPAGVRLMVERKEARKRAKYRKRLYPRRVTTHCPRKGA